MQFNTAQREIVLKVVYYGPPSSGKTTNLQEVHKLLDPRSCGRLMGVNTAGDRSLCFDLLPMMVRSPQGYRIKVRLFTVPGRVSHPATRRIVLAGTDAVIFVSDGRVQEDEAQSQAWSELGSTLRDLGMELETLPLVVQLNKHDLPAAPTPSEMRRLEALWKKPVRSASAAQGDGVLETLHAVLQMTLGQLETRYNLRAKFDVSVDDFLDVVFGDALSVSPR